MDLKTRLFHQSQIEAVKGGKNLSFAALVGG
jgi:hypothetical protein